MPEMLEYLEKFNIASVCLRLTLSMLLGGLIGLERGTHGQAAGIRTFALVCMGASLAMITDEYLVVEYQTGDPARLAAQVISGIGFLGVGTIIITGKSYVKGLTTAAGLWATACLGIAIGSGYIMGGIAAFFLIFFVMTALGFISHQVDDHTRMINLYMEADKELGVQAVYQFVQDNHFRIASMDKQKKQALWGKDAVLTARFDLGKRTSHMEILRRMSELDAIHYIEEIR